jgi:hypothetical protein
VHLLVVMLAFAVLPARLETAEQSMFRLVLARLDQLVDP